MYITILDKICKAFLTILYKKVIFLKISTKNDKKYFLKILYVFSCNIIFGVL